jgi:hypothetical protein
VDDTLIRDTAFNNDFKAQLEGISVKIDELEEIFDKLAHRIPLISRENCFLPMLHDLLLMCNSCFGKTHTEATRIGILKRQLLIPTVNSYASISEMMRTLHVNFKVCAQLFRMILSFGARFCNDGY